MTAFMTLTRAYVRSFLREPSAVVFSFGIPVLFIVVFGLLFGNQGNAHYDVGVALDAQGPNAQKLVSRFASIDIFKVHQGTLQDELSKLKKGDRSAVVEVPVAIENATGPVPIQLYADPTNTTTSQIVVPVLQQTINAFDHDLSGVPARLTVQTHSTTVQNLRYIDYLVPSILAMAVMQLGLYSAVTLVTQRETKLLRRLGATPLPRAIVISAQVTQRVVISLLQAVILIAVGRVFFHVSFSHDLPMLGLFLLLGTLAFVAMGFIVGSAAATQETAMPLVQFIALPMLFLSGIFFPVDAGPAFLHPLTAVMPLTYLADALRQATVQATAVSPLWVDGAVLAGWLAVSFALSVRLFRWE
ncbi:MAG TPA: ABC transporter permease [Dehalococcoidia bacterium]|nr:ABC transporter permease [Dehalococcoidia bacterium]